MKLKVLRFSSQEDSTSGLLFLEKDNKLEFLCYTLEDEYRDTKNMVKLEYLQEFIKLN